MWKFEFGNLAAYLLVFVRMSGMILFNPLFARRNIPSQIRMGFVLCLTILIAPTVDPAPLVGFTEFDTVAAIIKELFIGFTCAYVFEIFYYLLFFAGDLLDVQFGLSMAKIFDPGTSIQMSVSGNLIHILFILYIFATDSHLLLIKIFATSYDIVPVGAAALNLDIAGFIMNLFIAVFSLVVRLALPFIAAEFTVEVAMGVLMKLIPQIHVFVINIQFKLLLGIFLLFAFAPALSSFLDNYVILLFQNIENALYALAG